jgi:hypothetical protein
MRSDKKQVQWLYLKFWRDLAHLDAGEDDPIMEVRAMSVPRTGEIVRFLRKETDEVESTYKVVQIYHEFGEGRFNSTYQSINLIVERVE